MTAKASIPLRVLDNTRGRALAPAPVAAHIAFLFGAEVIKRLDARRRAAAAEGAK